MYPCAARLFGAQSDLERLRSVLVDMTKTSSDFRGAASKALEGLADGLLPRLRPIMDELGAVSMLESGGAVWQSGSSQGLSVISERPGIPGCLIVALGCVVERDVATQRFCFDSASL